MKYPIKKEALLTIALALTAGSLCASEVDDTRDVRFDTEINTGTQVAPLESGRKSPLARVAHASVYDSKSTAANANLVKASLLPAQLQNYVTPAMKNDSAFTSFLTKQHQFWTEKKALLEKNPELKEMAKKHLHLKQEMLKFAEKSPDYKKFFDEEFKYWVNKMTAEYK